MPQPKRQAVSLQDHDLVTRVRAGDVSAFEELFRMYVAAMLRFAMSFVADADAAEDIVQEVFGRVWLQRAEWQPAADVLSYLLTAVRNRALNEVTTDVRRATITRQLGDSNDAPAMGTIAATDRETEMHEQQAVIWGAVHTLPEQRRTVLLLRWRYGLEWEDVARVMGTSVAAARMTHSRAIQSLRTRLPDALD